jgi:hypothetical protein
MDIRRTHTGGRCVKCGWPLHDPYQIVSRHPVADGTVVYTRCACGTLRAWLARPGGGDSDSDGNHGHDHGDSRLIVGADSTVPDDEDNTARDVDSPARDDDSPLRYADSTARTHDRPPEAR